MLVLFDEPARNRLDAFRIWVREREAEEAGLMVSFIGKMPGFLIRLSLVLAFLDWAAGDDPEPPEVIGDAHVARAERLVRDYLLPMAERTYAEASVPAEVRSAQRIARLIVKEEIQEFTQRDITKRGRKGLQDTKEVEAALDGLVQAGWITVFKKAPGPRGGRGQLIYRVNTRVHELAAMAA